MKLSESGLKWETSGQVFYTIYRSCRVILMAYRTPHCHVTGLFVSSPKASPHVHLLLVGFIMDFSNGFWSFNSRVLHESGNESLDVPVPNESSHCFSETLGRNKQHKQLLESVYLFICTYLLVWLIHSLIHRESEKCLRNRMYFSWKF